MATNKKCRESREKPRIAENCREAGGISLGFGDEGVAWPILHEDTGRLALQWQIEGGKSNSRSAAMGIKLGQDDGIPGWIGKRTRTSRRCLDAGVAGVARPFSPARSIHAACMIVLSAAHDTLPPGPSPGDTPGPHPPAARRMMLLYQTYKSCQEGF